MAMKSIAQTLVAVLAAVLTVGVGWVGSSTCDFPLSRVNLDRGRQLFERRCASCHAMGPGQGSSTGPSLEEIGEVAQRRVPGMSAEEYLLESVLHPAAFRLPAEQGVMPADVSAGLTPDELMSLVGYLMTRHGTCDARRLLALADKAISPAPTTQATVDFVSVEAGRRLFLTKGKCIECHRLHDVPGFDFLAPSLLQAGHHDVDFLREAIQQPSRHIAPGYEEWNVVLASGKRIQGRLLHQGPENIRLFVQGEASQHVQTIDLNEVEVGDDERPTMFASSVSRMPAYPPEFFTEEEMDQIISFLKTLH